MTTLIFDPDARDEFLEAVDYYEKCRVGLGKRFRTDVEVATKSIAKDPFRVPHPSCAFPHMPNFQIPIFDYIHD